MPKFRPMKPKNVTVPVPTEINWGCLWLRTEAQEEVSQLTMQEHETMFGIEKKENSQNVLDGNDGVLQYHPCADTDDC